MTSVRRTASALLAVPLLALGACAGEEPEPIMPTESASSTPSASEPSPTPQPWEEKTDDGAVAFVEHWFDLLNEARLDGEISPMLEASTQDCASCNNFADIIRTWYEPGAEYESEAWRIEQISNAQPYKGGKSVVVRVFQPKEHVTLAGEAPGGSKAGHTTFGATVRWRGASWKMYELVIVE